jgi:hypothetical protein
MTRVDRAVTGSEQLLVLWTWLLEGYVPVAHIVAEMDGLEFASPNAFDDRSRGNTPPASAQLVRQEAA